MSLKTKVIENRQTGKSVSKTTKITREGNRPFLTTDDIIAIYNNVKNQHNQTNKKKKFLIKAMGKDQFYTFKTYDGDLDIENAQDYWAGKVENPNSLDKFFYVEVTVAYDA